MTRPRRVSALVATILLAIASLAGSAAAAPEGQVTWGVHVTLAPTWLDPAETPGIITPFMLMYALHDGMVKPMPDNVDGAGPRDVVDGLQGRSHLRLHAAEERPLPQRRPAHRRGREVFVRALPGRCREELEGPGGRGGDAGARPGPLPPQEPWPDFLLFYTTASGAGWIVPKKYVEKVGDEGYKKAPIGAGPYKFVSSTPGVEMVFEAFDQYWRKTPIGQAPRLQDDP